MPPIGLAGTMAALGTALTLSAIFAPFLARPRPDRIAGIVFGLGFEDASSMAAISQADPGAVLVDLRFHGKLVYVKYNDPSFPGQIAHSGALFIFDAVAAGCHKAADTQTAPAGPYP